MIAKSYGRVPAGLLALILVSFVFTACTSLKRVFNALGVAVAATDVEGKPTEILITDMGTDFMPCTEGQRNDSKIIVVDLAGNIVWSFDEGSYALNGAHTTEFNAARDRITIADTCNDRVLIVTYPGGEIQWDSTTACPELDLSNPNDTNFLENGNLLITDRENHWVIEVDPTDCSIDWSFGVKGVRRGAEDFDDPWHLYKPHNVDRLPNGNTIISDSGEWLVGPSRIIEVDPGGQIVWRYTREDDCTLRGGMVECLALQWARDAEVECTDPSCSQGIVYVTGIHQSVGVLRDLNEEPPPGEDWPRGRTLEYRIDHSEGMCYDGDRLQQWQGDTNQGLGFLLVSNHGPWDLGSWVRVVPIDAWFSEYESVWQIAGLQ
jgi:hypothetical protein